MGGSSGKHAVASAAAGSVIHARIKKEKKRAKKFGCFCCWCNLFAIVSFIVGAVLIGFFISSDSPSKDAAKGLTYAGIAFLILGVLLLAIGIVFAVVLWVAYRRLNGKDSHKPFEAKHYAPGTAPYPQQDWGEQPDPHHAASAPAPEAPPAYSEQEAVGPDTVKPEIH